MSTTSEKVHAAGALRHGADWANANQVAVGELTGSALKPWNQDVKQIIPRVILRILDNLKLNAGLTWNKDTKRWEKT